MKKSVQILSGREAASRWLEEIKTKVATLKRPPGLGILQVGSLPASSAYINQKLKAAKNCGIHTEFMQLGRDASDKMIFGAVEKLSQDKKIDGVITQLPLDLDAEESKKFLGNFKLSQFTQKVLETIPPGKDADGLHTVNQGRLAAEESSFSNWTSPLPATPFGIMKLLDLNGIPISGVDAVVIGKSRLVGTPIALMLSQGGATVTLCHKKTHDTSVKTRLADLVIVAAGVKHLVKPDWLNENSVVIDVGIHRREDGKLTGDVDPACYEKVRAYSPVPGGVGPMTVAALLQNVLNCQRL